MKLDFRWFPVGSIVTASLILSSCGKTNEVTVKNGEGTYSVSTSNATIPADFPLGVYPGSKITMAANNTASGAATQMVTLTSDDPVEKVSNYYKQQFTAGAWNVDNELTVNGTVMITGKKGTQRATVNVSNIDGKTTASLIINHEG